MKLNRSIPCPYCEFTDDYLFYVDDLNGKLNIVFCHDCGEEFIIKVVIDWHIKICSIKEQK